MKKIGKDIEYFLAQLAGDEQQVRINLRAVQVRDRYKQVMQSVYRETADLFLAHTNNVYIMTKEGVRTLIVYVDESIFAAELNAQRELIKLKLLQMFDENVEEFEIYVSRGNYKNNHPYLSEDPADNQVVYVAAPLTDAEQDYVHQTTSLIEDNKLKESVQKAMMAAMALSKTEKDKMS